MSTAAQYCRYCSYMVCGDANYCSIKGRCYSDEHIRHTNKCKVFDLNPIDAIRINRRGYRPRRKVYRENATQITWKEYEDGIDQADGYA